jgi:diphthamide biosynthesis methyltransferase
MNKNAELLNYVYQNSQMGVHTLEQLIDITKDENFKRHLESQYREYQDIHRAAKEALNKNGYDEKEIGSFDKIKTYLMINMQTLTDRSPSHISEMLIIGSNMGIINAVKKLKKYKDAEPDIINLMERLLKFEENNVQQLKAFL